jgi:hypothetical protein
LLAAAILLNLACAALAWAQVRRVERATSGQTGALAASLKRAPIDDRAGELARRASPDSWERRLASQWPAAGDPSSRVALVNEALADVEHALDAGRAWPAAAVRIASFGTVLLAAAALLSSAPRWALAIVATGGVGAIFAGLAGKRAESAARAKRAAVDELIEALVGRAVVGGRRGGRRRGLS